MEKQPSLEVVLPTVKPPVGDPVFVILLAILVRPFEPDLYVPTWLAVIVYTSNMELAVIVSFDCHIFALYKRCQSSRPASPRCFLVHLHLDCGGLCRFSVRFLVECGLLLTYAVRKLTYGRGVYRRGGFRAWFRVKRLDVKTAAALNL